MGSPMTPKINVPAEHVKDVVNVRIIVDGATKVVCTKTANQEKWLIESEK